jgi:short-subunit dehydrogenase
MKKKFDDLVVWISGASSGIGASMAKEFVKLGAHVALSARREDRLHELAESLGPKAHVYPLDVRDKIDVLACAQKIYDDLGRLDVAVANAGYSVMGPFMNLTEDMWRQQFNTNLFGVVWTLKAAIPFLKETKGRIGITSSVAGKLAFAHGSAYSASKYALIGLANALYQELYKDGVSVTTIAPGLVQSEIWQVDNHGHFNAERKGNKNMPFVASSEKAAREICQALYQRKREVVITGHGKVGAFLGTHFPSLSYWAMARSGLKPARSDD